jgi:hypothetical protein
LARTPRLGVTAREFPMPACSRYWPSSRSLPLLWSTRRPRRKEISGVFGFKPRPPVRWKNVYQLENAIFSHSLDANESYHIHIYALGLDVFGRRSRHWLFLVVEKRALLIEGIRNGAKSR